MGYAHFDCQEPGDKMAKLALRDSQAATDASLWEQEEYKEKGARSSKDQHLHGHKCHFVTL